MKAYSKTHNTFKVLFWTVASFFLTVISLIGLENQTIGILFGSFQILVLLILFLKRDILNYVLLFILFLSTSFEEPRFVFGFDSNAGIIYNFITLPFINRYFFYFLTFLPLFHIVFINRRINVFVEIQKFKELMNILKYLSILLFIGIIMSVFSILNNDNNVISSGLLYDMYIADIIPFLQFFLFAIYISYLILRKTTNYIAFQNLIVGILLSIILSSIFSMMFNYYGYYGTVDEKFKILALPLVSFFGVALFIFSFYPKIRYLRILRLLFFISSLLLIYIMLLYPSPLGGKWWLVVFLIITIVISLFVVRIIMKPIQLIILVISLGTFILLITGFIFDFNMFDNNFLNAAKFEQAWKTISFWEKGWYESLPLSPKFRFDEFFNTIKEFYSKPYYFPFGKGFAGSVKLNLDSSYWNNLNAFTPKEIASGTYFRLHESFNFMFLKFGLLGLYVYIKVIITAIRNMNKSPFLAVGVIWWLFFVNAYLSLLLGGVSLIIGLYSVDIQRLRNTKNENL